MRTLFIAWQSFASESLHNTDDHQQGKDSRVRFYDSSRLAILPSGFLAIVPGLKPGALFKSDSGGWICYPMLPVIPVMRISMMAMTVAGRIGM